MFKVGRGARLLPADLRRFGRRLEIDLEALMPGRSCRLMALSDWGPDDTWLVDDSLLLPIIFKGRDLGYLQISPSVPGDDEEFITEILNQGLEAMRLRKALLCDRETGLFSLDYFSGRLLRALNRRKRQGAAMHLSLDEKISPDLYLGMAELRQASEANLLKEFSSRVNRHIKLKCPARSASKRIVFMMEGNHEDIRHKIESALDEQLEARPDSRPVAAWVRWTYDLGGDIAGENKSFLRSQAEDLWKMAETALFYARQSRGAAVGVSFSDLVDHHGQITQVLPMDRVIINLGRATGAAPGQVFLVSAPLERPSAEPQYKGEVMIFEVQDSYSLAHVSGLTSQLRLVPGDRLSYSRSDYSAQESLDFTSGLPGFLASLAERDEFLKSLEELSGQPLTIALARFDAYDKTISMTSREECDKTLAFIFEKLCTALPQAELTSLWQPDTVAFLWPDLSMDKLKPTLDTVAAEFLEVNPVSFGLLRSEGGSGFTAELLISDACKALNEAAFSGPGQVAVFGPLALNISGDRLFESGDINGAIEEYERGLSIDPENLNLLNSLGVCYGRIGDSSKAMSVFEKAIDVDPENMMAHYNLGYTNLLSGNLLAAETVLAKAAKLAPENFETLFHLGKTALDLGHLEQALDALKKAAALENARPVVYRLLGEALMLLNNYQEAMSAFKKAVKAMPNDAYALSTLGMLFVEQANDLPVAKSLFQKSVEIDPTNSLYRQRLGKILFLTDEFSEAEKHLILATDYGARSAEVYYYLASIAEAEGRISEAVGLLQSALREDPNYKPALDKLGS